MLNELFTNWFVKLIIKERGLGEFQLLTIKIVC